ncbi:fungal antifreeze protein exerts hyperactivity By constructing an inequable beta-helix, partial [Pavlovales sp. CCMP2436]
STIPPVRLGAAEFFVILTKAGITTVPSSVITGAIGCSPIASTALTGFTLGFLEDEAGFNSTSTSDQVSGGIYASDYAGDTPVMLTAAVSALEVAYADAAGRSFSGASFLNVLGGSIAGQSFRPGVYQWGSVVAFGADIYIKGNAYDRWIFQMSGDLWVGESAKVILVDDGTGRGAPLASNVVWQVMGYVEVGVSAHLEGIILCKTHVAFKALSSINGRVYAQTAATLIMTTVTE